MFLNRYQKNHPQAFLLVQTRLLYVGKILLCMAIGFFFTVAAKAQEKNLSYNIKRGSNKVGAMNLKEVRSGSKISLDLESEVKASFIFSFKASGIEKAVFDNGILVYSSIYQKLNGSEKINKQTKLVGKNYIVTNKGTQENLEHTAIYYTMVCLYTHEPIKTNRIYSDKFQKYLNIETIADHHYKINFPDGNSNEYYYQNGICTKIEVEHSFYHVVFELDTEV